ncbi:CBS domain-containing protein [Flexivirga meconopsidis]|uniref:CBS domain-containing protein n=1 Tax=Flexivirga meconopsidis TaxID=2977121 RepID=UPI00223EC26E|nr:CBS domain-containing protein [Flexivirga meconopsidis]
MRARELAKPFPTVTLETDALVAAATMGERDLPGLVVLDKEGRPFTVVPASQVLRFVIPGYVQDDPHLARVYDEEAADRFCQKLAAVTIGDIIGTKRPDDYDHLPVVDADAKLVEVAAVMARNRSPLALVTEGDEPVGVIRIGTLLGKLLPTTAEQVPDALPDYPASSPDQP